MERKKIILFLTSLLLFCFNLKSMEEPSDYGSPRKRKPAQSLAKVDKKRTKFQDVSQEEETEEVITQNQDPEVSLSVLPTELQSMILAYIFYLNPSDLKGINLIDAPNYIKKSLLINLNVACVCKLFKSIIDWCHMKSKNLPHYKERLFTTYCSDLNLKNHDFMKKMINSKDLESLNLIEQDRESLGKYIIADAYYNCDSEKRRKDLVAYIVSSNRFTEFIPLLIFCQAIEILINEAGQKDDDAQKAPPSQMLPIIFSYYTELLLCPIKIISRKEILHQIAALHLHQPIEASTFRRFIYADVFNSGSEDRRNRLLSAIVCTDYLTELIPDLIGAGVRIDLNELIGDTLLNNYFKSAKQLIKYAEHVNFETIKNSNIVPLIFAASDRNIELLEMLLSFPTTNIDIQCRGRENTALTEACLYHEEFWNEIDNDIAKYCDEFYKVITLLLDHGANPYIKNDKQETASDIIKRVVCQIPQDESYIKVLSGEQQFESPKEYQYQLNYFTTVLNTTKNVLEKLRKACLSGQ